MKNNLVKIDDMKTSLLPILKEDGSMELCDFDFSKRDSIQDLLKNKTSIALKKENTKIANNNQRNITKNTDNQQRTVNMTVYNQQQTISYIEVLYCVAFGFMLALITVFLFIIFK